VFVSASCTIRYAERSTPGGGERAWGSLDDGLHRKSRRAHAVQELVEPGESGLRRQVVLTVSRLEDLEEPSHLGETGPAGRLDPFQRVTHPRRVPAGDGSSGAGLHDHHGHVVRDDVVQLARDTSSLRGNRLARGEIPVERDATAPVERHPTERDRDARGHDDLGKNLDPVVALPPDLPVCGVHGDRGDDGDR
jgi:hypothetical protein